jgi:hypothetical protein
MKAYGQLCQYFAEFFLEREMFQTKALENIKTHFFPAFFPKIVPFINVEKYGTAGRTPDDNMANELCNGEYLRPQTHTQNM